VGCRPVSVSVHIFTHAPLLYTTLYDNNGILPARGLRTLMMEATESLYQTTRRHIPGDGSLEIRPLPVLPDSRTRTRLSVLFCWRLCYGGGIYHCTAFAEI
jgi:hypothetical protein